MTRDCDDLGVHRVLRTHGQESGGTVDPGRLQRSWQLRITHYDRHTQAAAHLDTRIRRIRLDDNHPFTSLPKVAQEDAADITQPTQHDMIAHQRNPHLLHPIAKQRC